MVCVKSHSINCRPSHASCRLRLRATGCWTSREPRSDSVDVISCEPAIGPWTFRFSPIQGPTAEFETDGTSCQPAVILPEGDALPPSPRGRSPMTDTQGRSRAPLGGSQPSTGRETRSIAAMPVGAIRASGRAGRPTCRPIRSCPPYGWTARSCTHTAARRARPSTKALGRSRDGQIHILTDRRDRPLRLHVTGGQRHDSTQARTLAEAWTDAPLSCLIADRAYGGDAFRTWRA